MTTKIPAELVSDSVLGRRNLFINGEMQVAQRAATATSQTGTGFHTVDRWEFVASSAGTWDITQSTTVPAGEGFAYSQKLDCTSADASLDAGNLLLWRQKIEGVNLQQLKYGTSSAEKLTLSFWVRSAKTGTYIVELNNENSGGAKKQSQSYTISSADTWERKSVTFSGNTANTLNNDNALCFDVNFHLATGSDDHVSATSTWTTYSGGSYKSTSNQVNLFDNASNEWYLTGCQLEVGSVTTPFEHRSYGDELIRCMRYYETNNHTTYAKNTDGSITSYWSTITSNDSNTLVVSTGIVYKVGKRASPTVTLYNSANTTTANRVNAQGTERTVTATYGGPNALTRIYVSGASSGNYVTYNWEASAEL